MIRGNLLSILVAFFAFQYSLIAGEMDNIIIKTGKVDTVLTVFISPHCPICQQYSVILNDINKLTNSHDIKMIGVVSGTYYNQDMVDRFVSKFNIEYNILIDSNYVQRDRWNATVTPEAVLSIGDSVYYRGLIDDWFYEIGKSSNKTTSHYLLDAIQSMIGNREIVHKKTNPVGCVLE